jgi:asparagine N-glycosylation enzyme membrane subunit Stt3
MAYLGVDRMAYILPVIIGTLTAFVIYFGIRKLYNPRVALAAAFCFACALPAYMLTLSGNVDRDGLSLLLITLALFSYQLSKTWKGVIPIGLCLIALSILWFWVGAAIVMIIILASFLFEWWQTKTPNRWQIVAVLFFGVWLIAPIYSENIFALIRQHAVLENVAELRSLSIIDLFPWFLLALPIAYGVYVAGNRRNSTDILMFSWIAASLAMGFVAVRFSEFIVTPLCVLGGIGIAHLLETKLIEKQTKYLLLAVSAALLLVSGLFAYSPPKSVTMSSDWEDALVYVRDNTPADAKVMSWWDYGFWILDVAERQPIAHNGQHTDAMDKDISQVYCTMCESCAVGIMHRWGAEYLMVSTREKDIFPIIEEAAGIPCGKPLYKYLMSDDERWNTLELVYSNDTVRVYYAPAQAEAEPAVP